MSGLRSYGEEYVKSIDVSVHSDSIEVLLLWEDLPACLVRVRVRIRLGLGLGLGSGLGSGLGQG